MSRYIDADELLKRLNSCKYSAEKTTMRQVTYNAAISDACRSVDAIPTADVRKVVRCRDCSWHKPNDYFSGLICTNPYFEAEYGYISVDEEFYCANGTTDEVEE